MRTASIIINAIIFVTTLIILILCFRRDGTWQIRPGLKAFRFFTVLSNALCAIAALMMAVSQLGGAVPSFVLLMKYLGTVSVTVTLLTVFLFLGPSVGGYRDLLSGDNLYMHLIGPLLAILSFCLLEKRELAFGTAMTGLLPVLLYGMLYLYKVVFAPEDRRWEDFYGFNKGGKWPISYGAMIAGTAIVCVVFWLVCRM